MRNLSYLDGQFERVSIKGVSWASVEICPLLSAEKQANVSLFGLAGPQLLFTHKVAAQRVFAVVIHCTPSLKSLGL